MSILPIVSFRALARKLERAGFVHVATRGSHYIFRHPISGRVTSVPLHSKQDIGRGLLASILKQAGISAEEFLAL